MHIYIYVYVCIYRCRRNLTSFVGCVYIHPIHPYIPLAVFVTQHHSWADTQILKSQCPSTFTV